MNPLPSHIAIIMDGNGRWAGQRDLPREAGHRQGAQTAEAMVEACHERGISYLTLYAFSDENWERPVEEVIALMQLLDEFVISKRDKMKKKGIRFRTIGDISRLPDFVLDSINQTISETADGNKLTLTLALSYGSRAEICRAIERCQKAGIQRITPEAIDAHLDTAGYPDPDLLIRTSGEHRISNYLLWQLAYTELYFTNTMWPEFSEADLDLAIDDYRKRDRRYGRVS
ncbi:MAG: di-trans,poly-cis-decaprenylcistransferase [Deltaproteobacteria bacterium CG11_big_fil_rev_8_21_14_0_20_47_16]|nr:MAG: di-trans,poly-cis-decaprenylcistransferase [Deltaproteobacteria bacterium CG11_big_fil_rev_8_21_14_0_20_47_16]